MDETTQVTETPKAVPHSEILKRGLKSFQKVLAQDVQVNREDMMNLINFEVVVGGLIASMTALEGKSPEEIMAMYAQAKKD